ncbi:hypothetical protein CANARDRAFT_202328 [[Candida] arabinofermentans NRRL YB-2248]|uniref:Pseudouridine synthase n=1 Tax=[Candida] arabinofermentans NRRL YB-2248 TaxID=983967 RepID=A0A1E4SWM8_9ASCO|nr:hypothetical protein CANARDRAFT_202328 [[Candida] arabinofermentans NRRL YB-2248]
MSVPKWYFKNGLRYIEPYFHKVTTKATSKWINKTIIEVMKSQFVDRKIDHYNNLIETGDMKITRKGEVITGSILFNEKLQKGDLVSNSVHIHEIPVADSPIKTIFEDENLLVVDKPGGIPVHPTIGYKYNTILEILKHERGYKQLHLCHRLDYVTSGILIIAKNMKTFHKIVKVIEFKENLEKVYVARVTGEFPKNLECHEKIVNLDLKKPYGDGTPTPKKASTLFELIQYNPDLNESIVRCMPQTGRKHQLRIHLRNLGYPIVNDPIYGIGKILSEPMKRNPSKTKFAQLAQLAMDDIKVRQTDKKCDICLKDGYVDPKLSDMSIYLHSCEYTYKGGWSYTTNLPEWTRI